VTTATSGLARWGRRSNLAMVIRQIGYEQRTFWRTPASAIFTFALPVVFLVLFAGINKNTRLHSLGGIPGVQYLVPSLLAYGVMSACFVNLSITIVFRRDTGILKRTRGTPLPSWAFFAGVLGSALVVSTVMVAIALVVGRVFYDVRFPSHWLPFIVALVVGALSFAMLGLGVSGLVPNAEAAPAVINVPFLILVIISGTFFPFPPHSLISKVADFFPVSHFIKAVFAPFNDVGFHQSPWALHSLLIVAIWGVVGVVLAVRRFRWEPGRN